MGDIERNIDVVRRLEDAYNRREYGDLENLVRDPLDAHTAGRDGAQDRDALIQNNEMTAGAFPDKRTEILDIFGEGDRVVAHVRMTGTNTGGLPWFGIPANDRPIDTDWIQISQHDGEGRITTTHAQMDVPKLLMQLGAMPGPGGM